jgi:3-oxoadipate enol-lactonase / 4-carboxymuconolactone decarboxylase
MFVPANGIVVHVTVEGPPAAPAALLLHSLGTCGEVWDEAARALSRSFRVIRPDLRGHGLTEVTDGPYTIDQLARDALALLDALAIRAAHVAGLSLGGMVAQATAGLSPGRVLSLTLASTALALPPPERWRERAQAVRSGGTAAIADEVLGRWVTPEQARSAEARGLRAMLLRTAPEGYAAAAEALADADLAPAARALRVPALVLAGDRDVVTPVATAAALSRALPGAELVVIQGAAHLPIGKSAEGVSAAMLRFLLPPSDDLHGAGMAVRKQVLGEAHVARATEAITDLDRDFQTFITRTAWGGVWARPHFDRRTRSILTIALLATLGREAELELHLRASRNTGATPADVAELLLHVAVYAGIPAANAAMRVAKRILEEELDGR